MKIKLSKDNRKRIRRMTCDDWEADEAVNQLLDYIFKLKGFKESEAILDYKKIRGIK